MSRTHYRVLGVEADATPEEIEQSFRRLARLMHPDLNGGDGAALERMKELNVARTALTDPVARAAYDEELREAERAASVPSPEGGPAAGSWMQPDETPATPAPTPKPRRMTSAGRVVWLGLAALIALVVVVGVVWLREVLDL